MENTARKMNSIRLNVQYIDSTLIIRFLEAPEKGEPLKTDTAKVLAQSNFRLSELPESIFVDCHSARHGLKQKMGDSLAMTAEDKKTKSVGDAQTILSDLWKQLTDGDWNAKKKSEKAPSVTVDALVQQFHTSVKNGVLPFDTAAMLYKQVTKGLELPAITEEEPNEQEDSTENAAA